MFSVKELIVYPVKSMRGLHVSQSYVAEGGFPFDRIFTVTTPDGLCITARDHPQLLQFSVALSEQGIIINRSGTHQQIEVCYHDCSITAEPTQVWDDHFASYIAAIKVNQWLSNLLQQDLQLRWLGPRSNRRLNHSSKHLSFADYYPYLLVNQNSFKALKQRCPTNINMLQFRPNIIVKNVPAFAEDSWKTIRIGQVVFDLVKPCSRCILINRDPLNGSVSPIQEPLKTLQKFRRRDNGEIDFGWNMVARNSGIINVDDQVEVLATQPAYHYTEQSETHFSNQVKTINIDYEGQHFIGNNQQTLLEQLEQQGIHIPYSCRSGICAQCRIKLIDGEVMALRENAILQNGMILSCSCKPLSNLKLNKK